MDGNYIQRGAVQFKNDIAFSCSVRKCCIISTIKVDNELRALKTDALAACKKFEQQVDEGDTEASKNKGMLIRMMEFVEECLESSTEDFKLTITDIVDDIEVKGMVMECTPMWCGIDVLKG